MCLVRAYEPGFELRAILLWLSHQIVVGSDWWESKSESICLSHSASWVARVALTYSGLVEERAGEVWVLLPQLMPPPPSRNTYPLVEHLVSRSPAQSASEKPLRILGGICIMELTSRPLDQSYVKQRSWVPFK